VLLEQRRRYQRVEAVNERMIDDGTPAVFVGETIVCAVEPVARGKVGVV